MQYARLGNTGLVVSRLAFGNMTFGSDSRFPAVAKVDLDSARAMIHRAFDAGVNFLILLMATPTGKPRNISANFWASGEKKSW
ncbi:MAG: hypothetical protein WBR26_09770 [Candidatus Acidiferrum sp.]